MTTLPDGWAYAGHGHSHGVKEEAEQDLEWMRTKFPIQNFELFTDGGHGEGYDRWLIITKN